MEDRILPFSKKTLKALADSLELHSAMLFVDPETNTLRAKRRAAEETAVEPLQQWR